MKQYKSIAIDGPSGAGKSTMARALAKALGYLYVDTGAIYRTVGLYVKRQGCDPKDAQAVSSLLPQIALRLCHGPDGSQRMLLGGEDVSEAIRQHEISGYASDVSAIPAVRAFLLSMQRAFAASANVVMDGRDIGTVVLPQADVKIYLTATPEERARRRHRELLGRGSQAEYETVLQDILKRDYQDSHRAAAPLRQAEDAFLVDSTGLSIESSLDAILKVVRENGGV